ncbi:restriction endonuclease subunit S [Micrococcus sp.]|uniref:restriction endonuclease subunit S n=1 Tax=Micrococcus sp. TaxID=1271 RepID=UPI002A9185A5|nr:restriction endonuclease subunit S [Micrococcus sp.]MDY6054763.1 restriction endonuclease subunit S [Micrococcus sp.]
MNGIEWLPRLPDDWQVVRLSYICRVGTGEMDTVDADPEGDVPFYIRSPHVQRATRATGAGEAILTPGDGAVGEVFHHHRGGQFAAHQRVYVLSEFDQQKVEPRFFYWYFSSRFRMVTRGGTAKSTVESLRRPMFTSFPVVLPPLDDQWRIADYLDRETATIDTLIEKQRSLIAGLKVRRGAAIEQGVNGRLTSAGAERATGPSWMGSIPVGWRSVPLWAMFRREKRTGFIDEPMVSVFRDYGVVFKSERANLNETAEDRSIYQLVEPGWFVVNRMKAWQGSVGVSFIRGISSGHYLCFRPLHEEDDRFLNWLFRSPQYRHGFAMLSRGVRPGQAEIDNDQLRQMTVVLPPLNEQRAIADRLDRETARIDTLIAKADRFIELAQERRAALITAAVTGQLEIPTEESAA